ncbi:hypothetical protein IW261DRAFT_1421277 [Armillaria novae-zelandiae]|uniref:Uncharacterized protein n=1 Tax=Armillaria novae-zelandiae TaxID=153914 RepID=A0AA39U434_9AGAR|nr:hypothetical protein IW261DRAFT_1421277 [Armillaria novae-zelandiae]
MCQYYFQTRRGNKHVKNLMSAFIDLEAGVDREEVLEASEEEITNFIQDALDEDNISNVDNAPTAGPSTVAPVLGIPKQEKMWTDLLERATLRATRGQTVPETNNKNSIHDVPPEFWALSIFPGWEDIVVFHIGHCARPELGIKAAFIMPLLEKQVWLEVEMSYTLKAWLKDIPGVCLHNQQPILHALSPLDGFGAPLSTNSSKPLVIGKSKGNTGMVSKVYPLGCKVLLIPRLDPSARDKKHGKRRRLDDNLSPKLFNHGAIELDGSEKLKVLNKGEERFSQVEMAHEIPDSLVGLFAQSCHPLVRRYHQKLPRISEWCLVVGDPIMDTSSGQVGLVGSVGDHGLEIKCDEGLFTVPWAHCRKTFQVGQYMEITEDCIDRWAGWIHAIEDGLVHVVSHNARMNDKVEMCEVHPNLVMTGYVEDAIIINNPSGKPVLSLLVRLASYDPNMPYLTLWFEYLDVVNEELYLPLNEVLPLADNDDNLYHKHVPTTYVLEEKGRHRLHGFQFHAKYQGLNIVAAVRAKLNGSDGLKCVREDTSLHEELDPAVVLPIHPTARHYDMFLVISGEHCGKWVRGIQYKKILLKDHSDLEWTVTVIIPRTPFLHDNLMDERLVLHSSCMTLADEMVISQNLNENLRRQLQKPAQER